MRIASAASMLAIAAASLVSAGCTPATTGDAPARPQSLSAQQQIPTQLPRNVRPLQYTISSAIDAPNLRFSGRTLIDIEVLEATDSITLNAADLDISAVSLITPPQGNGAPGTANPRDISLNAEAQTATFRFASPLAPRRYQLQIDYTGKIYTQAAGLFALDYDTPQGKKRGLFTQFQAPDARRFFPGWDEPQFRTPYNLTVTVPANHMAVSNMPQAGVQNRPDGTKSVTFQTTPPMSSYLLFLGVGEFDRIAKTVKGGTEVGIVTKKGDGEKGRFALDESARILTYFNDYFGAYPLPKLDNIAGPGSSQFFAAMENWGAIFSFESYLLVDPAISTEGNKQSIASIAAHEIAHQWFGNLVTMQWWDDLWLNEGFASWLATKSMEDLHPEWEPALSRVGIREQAMSLDSVATTHPVVQKVATVEQISQAFDAITYSKGEAVITMLEDYVGEEAWKRGAQNYIRTYRLKNTSSDDFWRTMEAAAGKPVTAVAHDFTLQPGVPLIRVENASCSGGKTSLALRQGEFTRDRPQKQALSWRVPVIASTLGKEEVRTLVSGGAASMTLPGCGPVLLNSGQTGYYRTLYSPALLDRLTQSYASLKPIDQIGLLADNWGLGLAGYQSASEALDLVDAVPADANSQLHTRVASILGQIYGFYSGDPQRQALLSRYAGRKLNPVLARIGWTPRAGEPSNVGILRSQLIGTLGLVGDPAVVAEANRRFAAGDPSVKSGPLRTTILAVVSQNLDAAGWDRLRSQAQAETNPLVKAQLYRLLGAVKDPALAQRALDLALTEEPGATTSPGIISAVSGRHPELAFAYALQNRAKVEALVDVSSRSAYLPNLAGSSSDPAMIARLQDYATRNMTPDSRRPADIAIAAIQDRVRVRETRLPDITRWLEARAR
jgi:aminopeptidase N